MVYEGLESGWSVTEPKEHDGRFKESKRGDECSLPLVLFANVNVVQSPSDIELGKDRGVLHVIDQFRDKRQGVCCKDDKTAGRTKGVRHTCPEPLKGRGEARYFAPKGTQGKGGVGKKSKAEGLSAEDSLGSDRSARPEVRGAQCKDA